MKTIVYVYGSQAFDLLYCYIQFAETGRPVTGGGIMEYLILLLFLVAVMSFLVICIEKYNLAKERRADEGTGRESKEGEDRKEKEERKASKVNKASGRERIYRPEPGSASYAQDANTAFGGNSSSDDEFLMPIEDIFAVKGKGTVVYGRILSGRVSVGDEVELVGYSDRVRIVKIAGIIKSKAEVKTAGVNDMVRILLKFFERTDVERGQVLAAKGSISAHNSFAAKLVFKEGYEELSREKEIHGLCYFYTADSLSTIRFIGDEPDKDGYFTVHVTMLSKLPMKEGTLFSVRLQGDWNTVATGRVIAPGIKTGSKQAVDPNAGTEWPEDLIAASGTDNESNVFSIILVDSGVKKVQVINEIRKYMHLSLADAKRLIDNTPSVIKRNVSCEEAGRIKASLRIWVQPLR